MKHIILLSIIILNYGYSTYGQIWDTIIPEKGNVDTILHKDKDTIAVTLLVTSDRAPIAFKMEGYSVREKHNTIEGVFDPYFCSNCKYTDYWVHLYYLDKNKQPLPTIIQVWMAK